MLNLAPIARLSAALLVLPWSVVVAEGDLSAAGEEDPRLGYQDKFAPFLQQYCYDCHGADVQKAGVNLQALMGEEGPKIEDRREWETILELILSREMPPEKKPQPTETLRQEVGDYLAAHLDSFDCSGPVDPGSVTARRLNRIEYQNTIRDLLGVHFEASESFPRDEVGYGFDNIGDVLSLSPLLMEKYLDAAEVIVDQALLSQIPAWPPVKRFEETEMKRVGGEHVRLVRERYLGLYREGAGEMTFEAPAAGEYRLRIRTFQDKGGPENARMKVTVAGEEITEMEIAAQADEPLLVRLPVTLAKGESKISVAYTNNYSNNDARDRSLRGDRNLFVDFVEVEGPLDQPRPPLPASHVAILPDEPAPGKELAMARDVLDRFTSRAYRRPATEDELKRLLAVTSAVLDDGASFQEGIKVAVTAVLVSPSFLFRWELDPQRATEDPSRVLNGYEIASRLSYFLWSSMPDEELLQLAKEGKLADVEAIRAQVRRMMADPKGKSLVQNFTGQWLQTRNLESVEPDPEVFPEFDETLREAMQAETDLFVQSIVDEDQSLLRLLDSDYT